ncbi:fumarylacetoacetate hydrolase family protein [Nitrospirillum viridazoti]|uniref:5-oxopent-3-ene-1,2,5-tricarboxylate decarboxylase n=1 Tax=Nitrospirillum viridazoti CBAmc TaxID=1441467 RepID=A0A248K0I9_9PROT|nr:fumarylacetoacetate hydrolase family protein [Nitrospirillum amazonense]ASG23944.1 5-oxopent-3-ene-1,2,5-tricarboxylate decarboxylase [Nitrospirillum amazonense CBAmc]TWB44620.1 2-keto-4-pentenoate hydratase/2-oxohepta-3-ene-1,7-dioic acid hydratase in catechol pathway [Nitrospirillum amazonense]
MKFVTYTSNTGPRLGVVDGDAVIDLNQAQSQVPADITAALLAGVDLVAAGKAALASAAPRLGRATLTLAPVVPRPGKIICLGLNYYDHAKEGGREKPDYPWFFMRTATSLIGAGAPALRPRVSEKLDYEAELAVVIGKAGRHIPQDRALAHVFGYSCFNDISVRDYQKRTPQWTIGKNFDGTGAFGPELVTADALPAGGAGLAIQCRLNGQVMQSANTDSMIWGVAETIALLTECLTLEPGDVIVMGTPAGVGFARTPPVWMRAGDRVEVEIDGVGLLANTIQDEVGQDEVG